jgi:hypothetical protein
LVREPPSNPKICYQLYLAIVMPNLEVERFESQLPEQVVRSPQYAIIVRSARVCRQSHAWSCNPTFPHEFNNLWKF